MAEQPSELILKLLAEKAVLKNKVFQKTSEAFNHLKSALKDIRTELKNKVAAIDKTIPVEYTDRGDFETEFNLAGDTNIYLLHSNIFTFDHNHEIWKTSYVQEDRTRAFCGKIYAYNFLSDSILYNRSNDIGYLIARIFVNAEGHFFVEGKRQLGFLYNDFANAVIDKQAMRSIAESTILYSLDFDPFTPPYDQVNQLSVQEILSPYLQTRIATGKRLGFRFQADTDAT